MKFRTALKKLLTKYTVNEVVGGLLDVQPWEQLLLTLSNQCIFRANSTKNKKKKRDCYRQARVFHRALDEITLEKKGKIIFKIARRDTYQCQKCKKQFRVDVGKEENAKFDLDKGIVMVTCPGCGVCEG